MVEAERHLLGDMLADEPDLDALLSNVAVEPPHMAGRSALNRPNSAPPTENLDYRFNTVRLIARSRAGIIVG